MDKKTVAIVSYITIIGWVIAYLQYKDKFKTDDFVRYHVKQSLGIAILSIVLAIALNIIVMVVHGFYFLGYVSYVPVVLWIIGIINASKEEMKPLPLIGSMFENSFAFLN
jgi:uncharacterized membrane protein